jgi:hypothetical protein
MSPRTHCFLSHDGLDGKYSYRIESGPAQVPDTAAVGIGGAVGNGANGSLASCMPDAVTVYGPVPPDEPFAVSEGTQEVVQTMWCCVCHSSHTKLPSMWNVMRAESTYTANVGVTKFGPHGGEPVGVPDGYASVEPINTLYSECRRVERLDRVRAGAGEAEHSYRCGGPASVTH